jgi:hypothetical protein
LVLLSSSDEANLNKLAESERSKAGDIKDAMSILNAKKIDI